MKLALLFTLFFTGSIALAQAPVVDAGEAIFIGGIKQFITIKGRNPSLPLLLFLHGGPGGSVMNYADNFTNRLQEHFLVVQWDQRETGRTLEMNASPTRLSLTLFQNDTHELISFLLKRFGKEKLYLAGHSWGTALGFHIAGKFPELLYAYVAIGPMINQLESERIALAVMMEEATKRQNKKEMDELSSVHIPFETGEQLYYHRKWLLHFAGNRRQLSKTYVIDWSDRWLSVYNEACQENLLERLPAVGCPVYFFAGRKDYQTNSSIAEEYYSMLDAPKKGFFWFEFSAHSVPGSEPDRLQQLIIDEILPATFTIQKPARVISNH